MQYKHVKITSAATALTLLLCAGCLVLRQADYLLPGLRVDLPPGIPLPDAENKDVQKAISTWDALSEKDRARYPIAYHVYINSPAPGTFEGELAVGLAFSGGGTRGEVFGAACYRALEPLFLQLANAEGMRELNLTVETDYIAGVSTGALPAALLALDLGGRCPPARQTSQWPGALNVNLQGRFLRRLGLRPWLIARDHLFETNSRPVSIAVLEKTFFRNADGKDLAFGDLPSTPVLFLCSTRLANPSGPFIETRLPYRYSLDVPSEPPWATPVLQTFENTHADPMRASLGEACYNSISYPGLMRSGLMRVYEEREWVMANLDAGERQRMLRAREALPPRTVIELKDGGLID
ncbi:MAG: patatin-like phospholipase family protein, partial [Candidatus Hydrogenedentes bacterium]|nr:patatin-like phospholipase family protein [Candidatus Hydrogenedentota bacterium]